MARFGRGFLPWRRRGPALAMVVTVLSVAGTVRAGFPRLTGRLTTRVALAGTVRAGVPRLTGQLGFRVVAPLQGTIRAGFPRLRATGIVLVYKASPSRASSRLYGALTATAHVSLSAGPIRAGFPRLRALGIRLVYKATPSRAHPRLTGYVNTLTGTPAALRGTIRVLPRLLGAPLSTVFTTTEIRGGWGRLFGQLGFSSRTQLRGTLRAGFPLLYGQLETHLPVEGTLRAGWARLIGQLNAPSSAVGTAGTIRAGFPRLLGATLTFTVGPPLSQFGPPFQYFELWDGLQAAGGARRGFLGLPLKARRRMNVNGDDAYSIALLKTHRLVPLIQKGWVIREVFNPTGSIWREWVIDTYTHPSGSDVAFRVECFPPLHLLSNYPVETSDGDGYVYQETPAVQLPWATIVDTWIRARTPAWCHRGTLSPVGLGEVPFSDDSALSGLRRLEDLTDFEPSFTPNGITAYDINLTRIGAAAAALYLRTGKNIKSLTKKVVPGQVTRLWQITPASTDDAGTSGIAEAYWEVVATSGVGPYRVQLKAIHNSGAGPILYDDQFNHANLPGGANSLWLQNGEDGTTVNITGTFVATQELQVASLGTLTAGTWVKICASATGRHLTHLDAPAEIASRGVLNGRFESAFDDTLQILKNGLQAGGSGTLPTGWTGLGSITTVAGEWATSGRAIHINQTVPDGQQISAPAVRTWYIHPRKSFYSATAVIRLLAPIGAGDITFRVLANGVLVGKGETYQSPINAYEQLKISGLNLSAYAGTSVALTAEIIKSNGTGLVNMIVDNICLGPSLAPRAPCEGSNSARTWQGASQFLNDSHADQFAWEFDAVDLVHLGVRDQVDVILGQTVYANDDEHGLVTCRMLQVEEDPVDPTDARYVAGTLPARLSRKQATPADLVMPFFDPIQVQVADQDTRNAALFLMVRQPFTQDATTMTVSLDVFDTRGGGPTVRAVALGAAVVLSGSDSGPWVIQKPPSGAGIGRVVFTASLQGRTDVTDAIDVPEQTPVLNFAECQARITGVTASTVSVTVAGVAASGPTPVKLIGVTGSATLLSGPAPGISSASGTVWVFTRGAFGTGLGQAQFRAELAGTQSDDDFIEIAEVGRDTVAVSGRLRVLSSSESTVVVRAAMADPYPQGAGSGTITYSLGGIAVPITPASGQAVTPAATITEAAGTYVDFTISRPSALDSAIRVVFTFAASNRISDTDSIDVPAQASDQPFWKVEQFAESDTTATVRITSTYDPENRLGVVEFATQTGQGAKSSYVAASGDIHSLSGVQTTVTLIEGQVSKVFYRIYGIRQDATSALLVEDFVTVKASAMPTPPILQLSMDTAGNVIARIEGDDLTASLRWASSVSSMPTQFDVDSATASNNRQVTTGTLQTLSPTNRTCYVKAVAYSAVSGGGTKSIYVQATLTYTVQKSKSLVVTYSDMVPQTETTKFNTLPLGTNNSLMTTAVATAQYFSVGITLPKGVTITAFALRAYTNGGFMTDYCIASLLRVDNTGAGTSLAAQTATAGGGWATYSSSISETVANDGYVVTLILQSAAGDDKTRFGSVELTYLSPSYEVTY